MVFGDKVKEKKTMLSYYTKLCYSNTAIYYTDYNYYTPFCCFCETLYSKDFYVLCIHLFTKFLETKSMLYVYMPTQYLHTEMHSHNMDRPTELT